MGTKRLRKPRKFEIQITKVGYLFIVLTLGVGASALNTGNNLLYLIFSMMLSFIILSGLLSNNTLKGLRVLPIFPQRIFAQQEVPVEIRLRNKKKYFPSFSVSFFSQGFATSTAHHPYVLKIPPQKDLETTDHLCFPKRGLTKLPGYSVETSYPFGLIRKKISVQVRDSTVVYPELISIEKWVYSDQRILGEFLSGERGETANPYGIRNYVHGDAARLIHWKSSAKTGEWKTKEFEREKRLRVHIELYLLEDSSHPIYEEKAVSAGASLILWLIEHGYEVSLQVGNALVDPKGHGYIDSYLTSLALARPSGSNIHPESQVREEATIRITNLSAIQAPQGYSKITREDLDLL